MGVLDKKVSSREELVEVIKESNNAELFKGADDIEEIKKTVQLIEDDLVREELMKEVEKIEEMFDEKELDSESRIEINLDSS